jgi:hypothetical protein
MRPDEFAGIPGLTQLNLGHMAVTQQAHDPEDLLTLALTHRETALLVFGCIIINRLFPELGGVVFETLTKLEEVSHFQQFFEKEGDDPLGRYGNF